MSPIEPSVRSGQYIADLIQYVTAHFQFSDDDRKSKIYYGYQSHKQGIVEEENDNNLRLQYVKRLLEREH